VLLRILAEDCKGHRSEAMSDVNPPPSRPPTEGGYPPPPPPAHREPDWKRQAKNRERIAAFVVLPLLLAAIIATRVATATTTGEPPATDSPPTTSTEPRPTTTEATTTRRGILTGLVVTAPQGVEQASADAFAAALASALLTDGWPGLDPDTLQASLVLMATQCQILDSIAETDPTAVNDVVHRVAASLDAGSLPPDLRARTKRWYAAMFDAAADHLCPQYAVALEDAAADLRRGATITG
jgi:hypothetical protein